MSMLENLEAIKTIIEQKKPNFQPKVGIQLGSGLGPLVDRLENRVTIPYGDLPGFPVSHVAGHSGELVLGDLHGVSVICLKGRAHFYEGVAAEKMRIMIRLVKFLGAKFMITTNAAGSLRPEVTAGNVCLITDHINFIQWNPMFGLNEDEFGPRFFSMKDAYDPVISDQLRAVAKEIDLPLPEGVYAISCGPNFESPAECKALRILGAHLVGMSTVFDVLIARHCDLKTVGISAVTNLSADLAEEALSHEETLRCAKAAGDKLQALIVAFFKKHANELNQ